MRCRFENSDRARGARSANLGELSALLAREPAGRALALDLKDLVLADRQAIRFLRECEAHGIALRNCPGYIRVWIKSATEEP